MPRGLDGGARSGHSRAMMRRCTAVLFAFACLSLAPALSSAQPREAAEPPKPPPVLRGPTVYAGGGVGVLPDIGEPTQAFRLTAAVPLARWSALELFPYGYHFEATSH